LGYAFFERGAYNLNLIAVRSSTRVANRFDDWITHTYRESEQGPLQTDVFSGTTDPGLYWLQHPGRAEGTAILAAQQVRGSHRIGLHKGYPALVQCQPMLYYRDNNRDGTLDLAGKLYRGIIGANIHRANKDKESPLVEKWSAACVVFSNPTAYAKHWDLVQKSRVLHGECFTLTILDESQL